METNENRKSPVPRKALIVMGIIMICIYIGMGVLFFCNTFGWLEQGGVWKVLNYVCGVVLILYGIYRGYRLYKGIGLPV